MRTQLEFNRYYLEEVSSILRLPVHTHLKIRDILKSEFWHFLRFPDQIIEREWNDLKNNASLKFLKIYKDVLISLESLSSAVKDDFFNDVDPLLSIIGSLCGLRSSELVTVVESEELRFHFLFSFTDPPNYDSGHSPVSRREVWDEFLCHVLENSNRRPSCDEIESDEEKIDGLLDQLDNAAVEADEFIEGEEKEKFRVWSAWVRDPGDKKQPHLPHEFLDSIGGKNQFIETLPWLIRRKREISSRIYDAIENKGRIACRALYRAGSGNIPVRAPSHYPLHAHDASCAAKHE